MRPRIAAVQPVLMSRDVAASIHFYEQLGFVLSFSDSAKDPHYAAVRRDDVEIYLQWHDAKEWASTGDRPPCCFGVSDADGLYQEFRDAGVRENIKPIMFVPWGILEFHVRDPDGNVLQFYRAQ